MWSNLNSILKADKNLYELFGLERDLPRYDEKGEVLKRPAADRTTFNVFSVRPARRVAPDGTFRTEVVAVILQRKPIPLEKDGDIKDGWVWFRGGATLIIDPRRDCEEIRYSIIKNMTSASRRVRQQNTSRHHLTSPLRQLYFGEVKDEPFALIHAATRDIDHD
jgi:hypothetical protein